MANCLVTGGLGHIGSKLIRSLEDHNITVVDNFYTQRYCSLFSGLPRNVSFVESNFVDLDTKFLSKFDKVIHLAAKVDATASMREKSEFLEINQGWTVEFIDNCIEAGVGLFIFPSSTSVYGNVIGHEVTEDSKEFLNPQSTYAKTKLFVEDILERRHANHPQFEYSILRFGTIFGPSIGMRFQTAVNKFCFQACFGQPLTVWRDNYEMVRAYLGLRDAISAIKLVLDRPDTWNQVLNVTSGNFSTKDVIECIDAVVPWNLDIKFVDTPLVNQTSYEVNDDRLQSLGYLPGCLLPVGIEETIDLITGHGADHWGDGTTRKAPTEVL